MMIAVVPYVVQTMMTPLFGFLPLNYIIKPEKKLLTFGEDCDKLNDVNTECVKCLNVAWTIAHL